MAEIEEALVVRLKATAGVTALIGSGNGARVYPLRLPQPPTLPAVTYQRVGGPRIDAGSQGTGYVHQRIQVDCWGASYSDVKALAKQVRLSLNRWSDDAADPRVMDTWIERDTDLDAHEVKAFRVSQDYHVLCAE